MIHPYPQKCSENTNQMQMSHEYKTVRKQGKELRGRGLPAWSLWEAGIQDRQSHENGGFSYFMIFTHDFWQGTKCGWLWLMMEMCSVLSDSY